MPASRLGWSVLGDYLDCQRLCYYRHILKLSSKSKPIALSKGEIMHEYLACLYSGTLNHFDLDRSIGDQVALGAIFEAEDHEHLEQTIQYYINPFAGYKVVEVEKELLIDLGTGVPYTLRLDLLCLNTRGELVYIDHKTGLKNMMAKNLYHGALTGYWVGAHQAGYNIKQIIINQIVWAKKDKEGVVQYNLVPPKSIVKTDMEKRTWLLQKAATVKEYLGKVERLFEESNILNPISFRKNENRCYKFGVCSFNPICKYEIDPEAISLIFKIDAEGERNR